MSLRTRVQKLEERHKPKDEPVEMHVILGDGRCDCKKCAAMTDEQYEAYHASGSRLVVDLARHMRDHGTEDLDRKY